METLLLVLIIASSLGLILSVLLQESKSSGMGSAIGGGNDTLFSKKKSQGLQGLLKKLTTISGALFFISIFIFGIISK